MCGEGEAKGGDMGVSIVDCTRTVWIGKKKRGGGNRSHISKAPEAPAPSDIISKVYVA